MCTVLEGLAEEVHIDSERPFVIIGERISPTGRSRFAECLAGGDMSLVGEEALGQVEAGAEVVDVNVTVADVDEERILPPAVQTVAEAADIPFPIDTAKPKALAVCPGKPLVNSVTGEDLSPEAALPLVQEHGRAVIGLCMDGKGIPRQAKWRLEIAHKIIDRAEKQGITRET